MIKRVIAILALGLICAPTAFAQQYSATATNTQSKVNSVTPVAQICTGGVSCPAGTSGDPIYVSGGGGGGSTVVTNAGTFAVQNTAATPAGSALIGKVGIDQTTPGTTNAVQPFTYTGFLDSLTPLGANATFIGTARAIPTYASYFQAKVYSDQAGIVFIQQSEDGTNWRTVTASVAVVASGAAVIAKVGLTGNIATSTLRVVVTNSAIAETILNVTSSFTVN